MKMYMRSVERYSSFLLTDKFKVFAHLFLSLDTCQFNLTENFIMRWVFFNYRQENGDSSLHIAARLKNIEICRTLITSGAKADEKNVSLLYI